MPARRQIVAGILASGIVPALPRSAAMAADAGLPPTARLISSCSNLFGQRLLARIVGADGVRTVALSPYGLVLALEMLALGGTEAQARLVRGPLDLETLTRDAAIAGHGALRQSLAGAQQPGLDIVQANSAWLADRLRVAGAYADVARDGLAAQVERADLASPAALAAVNAWANAATRGLIPELVTEIDPTAALLLASSLYFKGRWLTAFDPQATGPGLFRRIDGSTREVAMIAARQEVDYARVDGLHAIALPYVGQRLRLQVTAAAGHGPPGELWQKVSRIGLGAARGKLRFAKRDVEIRLPRVRCETALELSPALNAMGLAAALGGGARYGLISADPVGPMRVIQRSRLDVDESGTEAAAATAVVEARSLAAGPPLFIADRPFLVTLTDTVTGLDLFVGYIADP